MELNPRTMCENCLRRQFTYGNGPILPPPRHIQRLPTCALSPVSQRLRWITSHRRRLLLSEYGDWPVDIEEESGGGESTTNAASSSNPDVLVIVGIVLGTLGTLVTIIAACVPFENSEVQPLILGIGPSFIGIGVLFCALRLLYCRNLLNTSCCRWLKELRPLKNAIGPSDDLLINWSNYRPSGWMTDDPFVARSGAQSATTLKSCLRKSKSEKETDSNVETTNNNVPNTSEIQKEEGTSVPET
ncbi:uncharacterized protein LOC111639486 [Centruroides sculpturatus]|uniref:uncharacterized protein LOC111639486 n=1 Tax=Centruroides sculpturatus TaxID=218467 RepID=UPI000C6C8B8D|nr:uncharacterized protein LOC111639486 [Centruroides sculpturatus]